jgi:hypothetical protein
MMQPYAVVPMVSLSVDVSLMDGMPPSTSADSVVVSVGLEAVEVSVDSVEVPGAFPPVDVSIDDDAPRVVSEALPRVSEVGVVPAWWLASEDDITSVALERAPVDLAAVESSSDDDLDVEPSAAMQGHADGDVVEDVDELPVLLASPPVPTAP